ncbi:peroxisomal biogenesis factor 13 isoform X2 [Lycorma delicatula]
MFGTSYPQTMNYSMYGGYGYGGGYSGLGGYMNQPYYLNGGRGFGMPYSEGGYDGRTSNDIESRFIQVAEESSRPAFQSIASVVRTFASVTMMLESTYNAMFASFQAVLGVADNFNRLRQLSSQIARYMSALAVIRTIYWFCRRVLYMLGLIKNHPSTEDVWMAAERSLMSSSQSQPQTSTSSWPIWTFFGILFGAPYAIYKLLPVKDYDKNETAQEGKWYPDDSDNDEAVALFDFRATYEDELSITAGERLKLPPARLIMDNNSGWTKAANKYNKIGFVPFNYIRRVKKTSTSQKNIEEKIAESLASSSKEHLKDTVTAASINQDMNMACDSESSTDFPTVPTPN